jgi:hypothetical protein
MKTGNLLFSAVQFFLSIAILCGGGFLAALPLAPKVRFKMAQFFFEKEDLFLPVGLILFSIGLILLVGFYFMYRRQYYQVKLKASVHDIELALLQATLSVYWKKLFPKQDLSTDVFLHKDQKIELVAEVPSLSPQEHKELLKKVENEVGTLLSKQLGYKREFLLTVLVK